MKIEFSSQRREMLLFLATNLAAVTSHANHQLSYSVGKMLGKWTPGKQNSNLGSSP